MMSAVWMPDVGWGQTCNVACNEFVQRNDLNLADNLSNPVPIGTGLSSFQRLWVGKTLATPVWFSSHNSPHHVKYMPGSCFGSWTNPTDPDILPCLGVGATLNEGIYTNVNLSFDPFVRYCLRFTYRRLICGYGETNSNLIVAISRDLTPYPITNTNMPTPIVPNLILSTELVSNFNESTVNLDFSVNPLPGFNQLWFRTERIGNNTGSSFVTINNIHISCTTLALTDININQVGNVINPKAVNSSLISTFVSHFWDFGDGSTSIIAEPTHTYTVAGPKKYVWILLIVMVAVQDSVKIS
ncbi:MAG: hypothetical protein IPO92_16620 [Saprospiraceae bacterium]|nr:hypothetical protein [Saprospiraceae bacterium]